MIQLNYKTELTFYYFTKTMTEELTQEQIDSIEAMIKRRMDNANESRAQASDHIISFLKNRFDLNNGTH